MGNTLLSETDTDLSAPGGSLDFFLRGIGFTKRLLFRIDPAEQYRLPLTHYRLLLTDIGSATKKVERNIPCIRSANHIETNRI